MMMNVHWGLITAGILVPHGSAATLLDLSVVSENNVKTKKYYSAMVNVKHLNALLVMKQVSKDSVSVSQ